MKQTGNTMLITGGGSGIGRALAEAFHRLGNNVIITGRTKEKLDKVTAANPGMKSLTVDMTDEASIAQLAQDVTAKFPEINVLMNNAGIMHNEHLREAADDVAEKTIATNLLGPIRLTRALTNTLLKQPEATVVNVSSGLAFVPLSMTPTYCATKAAIHSYTQSLRYQLRDSAIEVIELIPPYVATTLMGERQANDAAAMPLAEFIDEVMALFAHQPTPSEICAERVLPLRNAAEHGQEAYLKTFQGMNDAIYAARSKELTPSHG